MNLQFLTYSDWHGNVDPLSVNNEAVGGAAALASYFQQHIAENPNTLVFTGGDDWGASPPISSFFGDEPAVLCQRLMGLTASSLGNHNFDAGISKLQTLVNLAATNDGSQPGSSYEYLGANLQNVENNVDGIASWKIFELGGAKVGVVGITNPDAPTLV